VIVRLAVSVVKCEGPVCAGLGGFGSSFYCSWVGGGEYAKFFWI
jgi:hypothetical protein